MVTISYEIIGLKDARERHLPSTEQFYDDTDNWNSGVWRCEDGAPVEYIGDDLCEPEDAVLLRDWRWVAKALQAAYDLGRANGQEGVRSDGVV